MNEQALKALYSKIEELTQKGLVQWRYEDSSFSVSFSRSTIEIHENYSYDPAVYHLDIRNEDGVLVAYLSDEELVERDYGGTGVVYLRQDVKSLFKLIEKRVFKHDVTEKSLFEDLEKLASSSPGQKSPEAESAEKRKA